MSTPSAIPRGSTVLVTGVNSYMGSHVADQLLLAGYKVRGTARDATKANRMQELFDKKYGTGKFEGVVVQDMSVEGAYDEAIKGVALSFYTYFLHNNTPLAILSARCQRRCAYRSQPLHGL